MAKTLHQQIWERACGCCEYCQMPQHCDVQTFQFDHVRARKHSGATTSANLALACVRCNLHKGPNAAGFDPETDSLQPLFNPRRDNWADHFFWDGPVLASNTPMGRATIAVLQINHIDRVEHRQLLMEMELFPPRR